jgi:hypothetical protein
MIPGLSARKYGPAVREFADAYGLEKSAISEHFIEASRTKLQENAGAGTGQAEIVRAADRRDSVPRPADGGRVGNQPGWPQNDLGMRQGATENATVVGELLGDLANRELDFSEPRLYLLDGGKALSSAVK